MRTAHTPTSLAGRLLFATTAFAFAALDSAWAAESQKQVLVLYATRRDAQIVVVGDRELPRMLEAGLPDRIDYYSEFIDQARFPRRDYLDAFRDFLALKYRAIRFDLVIAMGDIPLGFVAANRALLFAGVPVVFFAGGPPPPDLVNATGVIAPVDLANTLALATTLQPAARRVFVVSGFGESNQAYERLARAQLRSFEPRLAITYLSGLPTTDLEKRLASLPDQSIVYYLVVDRDGANKTFHPLEYLDRVSAVARAPVYCWVDSAMDHGILGGSLKDQVAEATAVGQLAVRVLRGERADAIPYAHANLNVRQVDWRQLRRWGISEARVPADVQFRFKTQSAWSRYKPYIVATLAILLGQTALIAGLLVHRAKRRQAEARAQRSQAELQASYERIRDIGARLLGAQDIERSRIARELHDDIGQQLALLMIDLQLLNGPGQSPDSLANVALRRMEGLAKSLHDLSHRVHPAKLRLIGLVPALRALEHDLSLTEMPITMTLENLPPTLPHELSLCLFRIVQEALHNAIKHSGAQKVSVHLRRESDALLALTVADDGVGFDIGAAWGRGIGLISICERLEAMGGRLHIDSGPGRGTRFEIRVPVAFTSRLQAAAV
jgi:signal transduction histidine kinase